MAELDNIDKQLLRLLQSDGRLSNAELAEKVHISAATCHRRLQRLFKEKVIKHIRAEVDPKAVDRKALVIVGVVLDRSTPDSFNDFEHAIQGLSMILDCQLVAGEFDYLLRVRVKDIEDFNDLHAKALIALPAVRQIRTFFVMKEVTSSAPLQF